MNKKQKLIILLITLSLVLVCTGLSFAFFTSITNNESTSTIYAKGGRMNIRYANGSGNITMENIYPKEEEWVNKTFTVTGNNSTELDMEYRIYLVTTSNGFNAGDLTYSISGTSTNTGDKLVEKANQPLAKAGELLLGKGTFKSKTATHSYNLRIFYKETNENQNNGQGKSFTGYVSIYSGSELAYDTLVSQKTISYDHSQDDSKPAFNGPITRSKVKTVTFTNSVSVPSNAVYSWDAGEKQDGTIMAYLLNKDENGLYDLYIGQDEKVVLGSNASYLFSGYNKATTLDVSNIDTSNVTSMAFMFENNTANTISGLENFNTSKVTSMAYMFSSSKATDLNVSNFNTSNVTNMVYMFGNSKSINLDVSNFDTSKVTSMRNMFSGSQATALDLSSFDTSNVTDMHGMFAGSQATDLNVSNFDTSKVNDMCNMFSGSQATTLDLSSFDTSNVIDMQSMFRYSKSINLDVSNFDTSNVTDMSWMFMGSAAIEIKGLNNFDTSNVTNMFWMFGASQATTLDLSGFDTSNVTNMSWMFRDCKATIGYARTQADADKFNASDYKPSALTFTVKS